MELLNASSCRSTAPTADAAHEAYRRRSTTAAIDQGPVDRQATGEESHMMRQMVLQTAGTNGGRREGDTKAAVGGGRVSEMARMSGSGRQPRSGSSVSVPCQDCGNQAKKDCAHVRCRTCCKSRGFDCATHVRSTWVPAAKRRERQQAEIAAIVAGSLHHRHHHHQLLQLKSRRTRAAALAAVTSATLPHFSVATAAAVPPSSYYGGGSAVVAIPSAGQATVELPPEIKTQALFQCVRVAAVGGGGAAEEYAYRAVTMIGGRVFKGLLYDQGEVVAAQQQQQVVVGGVSMAELQLGGERGAATAALPISTATLINLAGIYGVPAAANSFIQGPF